jgi:uncharacterized protein YdhG (YjbR/CyaY superfamily)
MTVIDDFLQNAEPSIRRQLERIRKISKQIVPEAEDCISYGMPALKYKGKQFIGFSPHKNHIGIYPHGKEEIEIFKNQLVELGYGFSSGTIRIPFDKPIPENLLTEIIKHRIKRII